MEMINGAPFSNSLIEFTFTQGKDVQLFVMLPSMVLD